MENYETLALRLKIRADVAAERAAEKAKQAASAQADVDFVGAIISALEGCK